MSVVNKMLRDLEDRKADDAPLAADYQPAAKSSPKLLVSLLVLLPLLAVAVWFYLTTESKPTPPSLVTVPVQTSTSQQQDSVEPQSKDSQNSSNVDPQPELQQYSAAEPKAEIQAQKEPPEEAQAAVTVQAQALSQEPVVVIAPPTETQQIAQTSTADKSDKSETEPKGVLSIRSNYQDDSLAGLKQKAQLAVEQGDTRNGIKYLTQILSKEPDNINVRKKLAAMQFSQGNYPKAQSLLEEGMGLHPDSADLRLMLARLHVQRKDLQQAHQVLMAHPVSAAVNPDYLSYRASIASQLEDYQAAKEDYVHLINSQPSNSKWWLGLGVSEEKLNNQSAALLAYRQAQQFEQLTPQVQQFVQQRIRFLAGEQ